MPRELTAPDPVTHDLHSLTLGKQIGQGESRTVYEWRPNPAWVIKHENDAHTFQNPAEWNLWQQHQHEPNGIRSWLAPCHLISHNGIWLIQARTTPARTEDLDLVPKWFGHVTVDNFGWLDGRLVCHDYAHTTPTYQ